MSLRADGCVRKAGGPVKEAEPAAVSKVDEAQAKEEREMTVARVGKEAPDFVAPAYFAGGFKDYKLSDYRGKWVLLCFYPGDFTYV